MAMSIDDKLGLNKFNADLNWSHIDVDKEYADKSEVRKVVLACPAHLYRLDEDGSLKFNHEGHPGPEVRHARGNHHAPRAGTA